MRPIQVTVNDNLILENEMVTAAHPSAAQAGAEIMASGGNAVDAAVATALALGVVDPCNSGIGGYGGFAVIALHGKKVRVVNFNTVLPKAAREFEGSELRETRILRGVRSITVPGILRGLEHMVKKYGSGDLAPLFEPAIRLAENGFIVSKTLHASLSQHSFVDHHEIQQIFSVNAQIPRPGETIRLPIYAKLLKLLQREGVDVFYNGDLGEKICRHIQQKGGFLSITDLKNYQSSDDPPNHGTFRDLDVYTATEGSKGEFLLRLLKKLEDIEPDEWKRDLYASYEQAMQAMTQTWLEFRSLKLGHTTHLTVVDRFRNVVSLTLTHGPSWFGSGVVDPDTGIVLNNGLNLFRDFQNRLMENAETNMAPTVLFRSGSPYFALGTPGGRLIPTLVAQQIVNVVDRGMNLYKSLNAPRYHSDRTGVVELEGTFSESIRTHFRRKGYIVKKMETDLFYGPSNGIMVRDDGQLDAGLDTRWNGSAAGW